ncbi:MAG: sigma-70 family RNA polymerase sigma factor [Myxococcales bacterium]|nr:sigma-70 family RNA polymerase sigma factor [Myxococcales bacterium]
MTAQDHRMAMPVSADRGSLLAAPELRSGLVRFVRGRVPEPDVEDVVQATLADAFAAREAPSEAEELRRWVFGIAKNKIVDVHRKGGRELPKEGVGDEASAESAPMSARDLLRWAEDELPEAEGAQSTLEWMLREGDGEKLEHIAEEAQVPAPRVRQRVSRMRKYFRSRWAAQLAAAAALAALGLVLWTWLTSRDQPKPEEIAREVPPDERAREIRRIALERCQTRDFAPCLEGLDRAKAIDPVGDEALAIREARAAAARGLAPAPSAAPSPEPTGSAPPPLKRPPPDSKGSLEPPPTAKPPPPTDVKKMAPEKGSSLDFGQAPAPQKKKANDWSGSSK